MLKLAKTTPLIKVFKTSPVKNGKPSD